MKRTPEEALALIQAQKKQLRETEYVKFWEATPKQAEILKKFTSEIKIFGVLGGNRSGKTELGAFLTIAFALGKEYFRGEPAWEYIKDLPIPEPPNNIWVVGLDFSTLRDVIWREKLRFGRNKPGLVPVTELSKPPNDSDFLMFFKNGSIINGKSADSGWEKFQGASVDLVWIDEEPEENIFNECYQRTVDCGGKIFVTLTPLTDVSSSVRTPWVFDLHQDAINGQKDVRFTQLSVMDNPYIPAEEKEKLRQKWAGHPEEGARLYGDFVKRSGLVYFMWDPKVHMVKPFLIPSRGLRIVSIDGASTGVTAALFGWVQPGTNDLYLYREYYTKNLVVSDHAKNIIILNQGDPVDYWLLDPFWGKQRGTTAARGLEHRDNATLYRDAGIPVRLASVGDDYGRNESLEYMNATITVGSKHPKVFVFEGLENFKSEIEHYVYDFYAKGAMKGLSKDKPMKRNDHLMNAFQYMAAGKFRSRERPTLSVSELTQLKQNSSYT